MPDTFYPPEWWTKERPFMVVVDEDGNIETFADFDSAERVANELNTLVWTINTAGEEVRADG